MPSTYSSLKIELIGTGEQAGTWGTTTNANLGTAIEEAITGSANVTFSSANVAIALTDTNATQTARNLRLNLVGTLSNVQTLFIPAIEKQYIISNGLSNAVVISNGSNASPTGTNVSVPAGRTAIIFNDGANVAQAINTLIDPSITGTILEDIFTITDAAGFEVDPSNGSIQLVTLGANRTPKATFFTAGEAITLMVDDGSAYSITWTDTTWGPSGVIWKTDGGVAPTLNTTGYTVIVLWKVASQVYGARVGNA